jgi:hypothetical protein
MLAMAALMLGTWGAVGADIYDRHFPPAPEVPIVLSHLERLDCADPAHPKTFMNETVEIDGKDFENCKFINVRLVYHGKQTAASRNCEFDGTIVLYTDKGDIAVFGDLLAIFGILQTPAQGVTWGDAKSEFWVAKTFLPGEKVVQGTQ